MSAATLHATRHPQPAACGTRSLRLRVARAPFGLGVAARAQLPSAVLPHATRALPRGIMLPRRGNVANGGAPRRRTGVLVAASGSDEGPDKKEYPLEKQRWVQLGILSALALLSDWVCFSTAAVPNEWVIVEGHPASQLIDIFLFSNVVSCFMYTDIAAAYGLRKCTVGAASLMAVGCILRSGVPIVPGLLSAIFHPDPALAESVTSSAEQISSLGTEQIIRGAEQIQKTIDTLPQNVQQDLVSTMPSYRLEVLGTIFVGAAQPFFQCAPPLLSATWFGPKERALATATAINFNQVGIATAFIVGGFMANSPAGMHLYFDVVTVFAILTAIATFAFFRERPALPPSASAARARAQEEEEGARVPFNITNLQYPGKAKELLRSPGFTFATAAFVASIGTTNVISTFTAPELARAGFDAGYGVDLAGAGFQFAIVAGGILVGSYVDETKDFKRTVIGCLSVSVVLLGLLGVAEGYIDTFDTPIVVALLLALGFLAGPVQPISAELAVETSYPCDENAVEATQQLAGNLFSALLVPFCEEAARFDLQFGSASGETMQMAGDVRGDTLTLLLLVTLTTIYFTRFNAPLTRSLLDAE